MNPSTDTGATEFLANLSVGTVVGIALLLTLLRLALLATSGSLTTARTQEGSGARAVAEIFESLIIAGVLVFLIIRPFFVQAFFIPSESMERTLLGHDEGKTDRSTGEAHKDSVHDHIFVNKLVYRYSDPKEGDIVVFKAPKSADAEDLYNGREQVENVLIKRCIGVPGDVIEVKEDGVWRNGKHLDEFHATLGDAQYSIKEPMKSELVPNFKYATVSTTGPFTLKPGQYWMMGDNRNDSNDSRYWGPLDRGRIMGKASFIFYPFGRIRVLR